MNHQRLDCLEWFGDYMSKPSFQFYPDSWLNDLGLRRCSSGSRGIWADLLCLAHQGEPYGFLRIAGENLTVKYMACRCTVTPREMTKAIEELESNGVFSRTEEGTIYSRRMVRDEYRRTVRGHGGSASLMNDSVPKPKRKEGILTRNTEGILPSDPEGVLHCTNVVPFFDPKEGEGEEEFFKKTTTTPRENSPKFDPIPGWLWFKSEYPEHRLNTFLDFRIWSGVVESMEIELRIRASLPRFKACNSWARDGGQYVPSASNFLGKRIFEMPPPPDPDANVSRNGAVLEPKRMIIS